MPRVIEALSHANKIKLIKAEVITVDEVGELIEDAIQADRRKDVKRAVELSNTKKIMETPPGPLYTTKHGRKIVKEGWHD